MLSHEFTFLFTLMEDVLVEHYAADQALEQLKK